MWHAKKKFSRLRDNGVVVNGWVDGLIIYEILLLLLLLLHAATKIEYVKRVKKIEILKTIVWLSTSALEVRLHIL